MAGHVLAKLSYHNIIKLFRLKATDNSVIVTSLHLNLTVLYRYFLALSIKLPARCDFALTLPCYYT